MIFSIFYGRIKLIESPDTECSQHMAQDRTSTLIIGGNCIRRCATQSYETKLLLVEDVPPTEQN